MDIATLNDLHSYGGKGFDYLLLKFIPLLRSSARPTRMFRRCSSTTRNGPSPSLHLDDGNDRCDVTEIGVT